MFAQHDVDVSVGGPNCLVRDLGHFPHKVAFFAVVQPGFEVALDEWHFKSPLLRAVQDVVLSRRAAKAQLFMSGEVLTIRTWDVVGNVLTSIDEIKAGHLTHHDKDVIYADACSFLNGLG